MIKQSRNQAIKQLFLLLILVFFSFFSYSQPNSFECGTTGPIDWASGYDYVVNDYCDFSNYGEGEVISDLEIARIEVEFHIVRHNLAATTEQFYCDPTQGTNPRVYLPTVVNSLLFEANKHLGSPAEDFIGSPGVVEDTRIRYRFDPDPNNTCDGFTFYDNLNEIPNPLPADKLHIVFFEDPNQVPCFVGGAASRFNVVRLHNLFSNRALCTDLNKHYAQGRLLNHEFGHVLGLPHGHSCFNDCYDMDPIEQCMGGNNQDQCWPTWGGSDSGFCGPMWGNTNNMMSYNPHQTAITPCQWDKMMNALTYNSGLEYVDFCTHEHSDLTIPAGANLFWNDHPRFLNRNIIIETGATLTVSCQLRMGTGKRIIVKRGAKLNVDKGWITNLCRGSNWEGIIVHGNVDKEQPDLFDVLEPDDAGVVHIFNESIIQNADVGVNVRGRGFVDYSDQVANRGGMVVAENSSFRNNKVGVGFMKYEKPNKSEFINCVFEELEDCDHRTYTGVTIWACRDILFQGNTFQNLDGTGIEGIGLGINVLSGNTFRNLFPGILILDSSSSEPSNLTRVGGGSEPNIFEDNPVHILSFAADELSKINIRNNDFSGGVVGAEMNGPSRFSIFNNDFENMDHGVRSIHTLDAVSEVDCNSFKNIQIPLEIQGNNEKLTFAGNVFEGGLRDVLLRNFGTTAGEILSVQGQVNNSPNNCFSKTNQSTDITTGNNTISFRYLIPSNNMNLCIDPEIGTNNYVKQSIQSNSIICGAEFIEEPQYSDVDLYNSRDSISDANNVLINNPGNQVALQKASYYRAAEDIILRSLIKDKISQSDYSGAQNLISNEPSFLNRRLNYTIKMAAKDYEGAEAFLLNSFPSDNLEDIYFVRTQRLHLAGLTANESFTLTESEKADLCIIRNSNTLARNYAEGLLWLYDRENYEIGGGDCKAEEKEKKNTNVAKMTTLKLYPNPARDIVICNYPVDNLSSFTRLDLNIYDITGQQIFTALLDKSGQQNISLVDLSEGVYFVTIRQDGIITTQEKLVVIK